MSIPHSDSTFQAVQDVHRLGEVVHVDGAVSWRRSVDGAEKEVSEETGRHRRQPCLAG